MDNEQLMHAPLILTNQAYNPFLFRVQPPKIQLAAIPACELGRRYA